MAAITANMVKELREKTGAGMLDCKKALDECAGDMEKAIDELRKKGQAKVEKRGGRATKEGLVFSRVENGIGVLVDLNCETDFVARNDDFRALGKGLADLVYAGGPAALSGQVEELLATTLPQAGKPVREALSDSIAKIGENMSLSRFARIQAGPDGAVTGYIHPPGKLGVLVELRAGKKETLASDAAKQLAADLAMQVAAAAPVALNREAVSSELLDRERAIYRDQVRMEGKPEKIWDKIVEGKVAKFFKDSCLMEQEFIKDAEMSVTKLVESVSKQAGDRIEVVRFVRFEVGGGEPKNAEAEA